MVRGWPTVSEPVAGFGCSPSTPASGDLVRFFDYSYDPGHQGIVGWRWAFGDGSVSEDRRPEHRYEVDGDYNVELVATTPDGREGIARATIEVRTHEVAIETLSAPERACVGETVDVIVGVSSCRYDEVVDVRLFVRSGAESPSEQADRAAVVVRAGGAPTATSAVLRAAIPATAATAGSVTVTAVVAVLGLIDPVRRERSREISIAVA